MEADFFFLQFICYENNHCGVFRGSYRLCNIFSGSMLGGPEHLLAGALVVFPLTGENLHHTGTSCFCGAIGYERTT